jgi:hypothetical protein
VGPTNDDTVKTNGNSGSGSIFPSPQHEFNHPTVSGTSVYMDDTGVIDMSNKDTTSGNKQVKTYGSIPHLVA